MFTMTTRPFANRSVAHKWAVKQRPNKADRLVLVCEECPPGRRSQRRLPRWSRVAADVAEAVDADPAKVHRALVVRQSLIFGYRWRSLMRASSVVKRHSTGLLV